MSANLMDLWRPTMQDAINIAMDGVETSSESPTTVTVQETVTATVRTPSDATSPAAEIGDDEIDVDDYEDGPVSTGELPKVPKAAATKRLADALMVQFGHPEGAARAIARAVTRPEDARKRVQLPVEERVPGGTVLTISSWVWSPAVSTFPDNMREAVRRKYPFALVDEGSGDHTPLPPVHSDTGATTELTLAAARREAVVASLNNSATFLKNHNNYDDSVRTHGVLREVLVVPVRFEHKDGSRPQWILAAADGSSRTATTHRVLNITPSDVVYGYNDDDHAFRTLLGRVAGAAALPLEELSEQQRQQLRSLVMPAKIIVGFRPDPGSTKTLAEAVRFIVGITHVEPPTQWDTASKLDAQAEAVLEDLFHRGRISEEAAGYFAGLMSPSEAEQRLYSRYADARAAAIVSTLLAPKNRRVCSAAIRRVTARARIHVRDIVPVAAELALRGWPGRADPSATRVDGVRSALQRMLLSSDIARCDWSPTGRTPDVLLAAALGEINAQETGGPAAVELGMLGGWYLVVSGFMQRELRDSPSKTALNKVFDTLIRSEHGLRLLADALARGRRGERPRAINEDGVPVDLHHYAESVGLDPQRPYFANHGEDDWLRRTFMVEPRPEPEKPLDEEQTVPPETQLEGAKGAVGLVVSRLEDALRAVTFIEGYARPRLIDEVGWRTEEAESLAGRLEEAARTLHRYGWLFEETREVSEPTD
ncbi:hypothetical protein [Micromonospora endolithica]|uniref:Uncharacterized protein n=1 Tax=Micromonospora endolithica TaxID=230091 RepID=A0A3A9ZDD6_9ACTN|nr:hypothetical protein [Micromonospora endolithica]RKN46351.1 hypothetical protein D7223_15695 [Micromonospora endolithica]TWJ24912.1 hypothetical protein JD76_05070 [Micromonospora endolithica]